MPLPALSPVDILIQALSHEGLGVYPPLTSVDWALWSGHMPNAGNNAIVIRDIGARQNGRYQGSGETIDHPLIQFRIRGVDYETAYAKAVELGQYLDTVANLVVTVGASEVLLVSLSKRGRIVSLGNELDGKRQILTMTFQMTLDEHEAGGPHADIDILDLIGNFSCYGF